MCGIAGWYRRGGRPVPRAAITAQCDSIRHRGPDDDGILIDGDFGFGMRRLSILDIAHGHQPMTSQCGRYAIVFNGEIYNHQDLRGELAQEGARFRTHSDTETILAAFAMWGDGAWTRLEGMFAVAIWDGQLRRLTLARDPLGIKPLYLSQQAGGLSFASELKALRVLPDHRFDVDERAVNDVVGVGHVRRPRSIFRQVGQLDPGHSLSIDRSGKALATAFWKPRFDIDPAPSSEEWIEQMRELLLKTTARHLQADVPVAAFLSGGVDSAAVLAAMVRSSGGPVKAFTIGHPGSAIDETEAASEIARHLGAEHFVMPLDADDAIAALPAILSCYDEPFADLAAIPTWFASKLAAEHVKVVLCGEGGDELFAGYKRHRNARAIARLRPFRGILQPLGGALARLPDPGSKWLAGLRQNASRFTEFMALDDGYQQFFAATRTSALPIRNALYTPDFAARMKADDDLTSLEAEYFASDSPNARTGLEQFLLADLTLNMPSAMLTRLDRASMAHSLEARVPFLSHRLVDWAMTVPDDLKLHKLTGKYIVRKAVAPWLPRSVMTRPKQGFQIPHAAWLRGSFGRFARETWHDSGFATAGYIDIPALERLYAEHISGQADHARLLYAVTAFAIWWRDTLPGPVRAT